MKLSDFAYELRPGQIAQEPVSPRDHSRLMVVDSHPNAISHHRFFELDKILKPGDALVLNATRVFPARLRGRKTTGGKIELLLLGPTEDPSVWRTLVRGSVKPASLEFADGLRADLERSSKEGEWLARFSSASVRKHLATQGEMPLPPYIKRPVPQSDDTARYQTVYAQQEGAVAAPTAGFHFTPELLGRLRGKGIQTIEIVLHVGWGTFRPLRVENVEDHPMLPETYDVSEAAASALNQVRPGGRVVAVGTTAVRTLESVIDSAGKFHARKGETNLFIYPGYRFRAIDALITNFHLPDSTPLLLACAFRSTRVLTNEPFSLKEAYFAAIEKGYRFYSYGDSMLIN